MILEDFNDQIVLNLTKGIFSSNNVITIDLCFLRAWFIMCVIWAVCSNVPETLGRNAFWSLQSI